MEPCKRNIWAWGDPKEAPMPPLIKGVPHLEQGVAGAAYRDRPGVLGASGWSPLYTTMHHAFPLPNGPHLK